MLEKIIESYSAFSILWPSLEPQEDREDRSRRLCESLLDLAEMIFSSTPGSDFSSLFAK
jgi:hypothetical protein